MTDRPILFSTPMVRALLAGTKTQTRRDLTKTFERYPHLVGYETNGTLKQLEGKSVPHVEFVHSALGLWHPQDNPAGRSGWYVPLKAAVGDRLWVRETWQGLSFGDYLPTKSSQCEVRYAATDPCADLDAEARGYTWRPSIFMPRFASRLTLTVTEVRVERLQDISEADCVAEGIEWMTRTASGNFYRNFDAPGMPIMAFGAYRSLWNHINGAGSWEANPWVVAYSFSVHHSNIDQLAKVAA